MVKPQKIKQEIDTAPEITLNEDLAQQIVIDKNSFVEERELRNATRRYNGC